MLGSGDDEDDMMFKDIEALKAHIFSLSDNHMEQVVSLVRGWMKRDETKKLSPSRPLDRGMKAAPSSSLAQLKTLRRAQKRDKSAG